MTTTNPVSAVPSPTAPTGQLSGSPPTQRPVNQPAIGVIHLVAVIVMLTAGFACAFVDKIVPHGAAQAEEAGPQTRWLALRLVSMRTGQDYLGEPPYFRAGGQWTVLKVAIGDSKTPAFTIALEPPPPRSPNFRIPFGRAIIFISDPKVGDQLVAGLAKALNQTPPPPQPRRPLVPASFNTVVPQNHFSSPDEGLEECKGSWVVVDLYIPDGSSEGEIFFVYNPAENRAGFCEYAPEQDEKALKGLAAAVRDGPR